MGYAKLNKQITKMQKMKYIVLMSIIAIGAPSIGLADDDYDAVQKEVEKGEKAIHSGGTIGADKATEHWGKAVDHFTGNSQGSSEGTSSDNNGALDARD
ncbi:MAG: hypothetical protein FGM41_04965 [Bacteroidetes bacterium]|nr:hypothetical protein [Bacteroidota bacterium]